MQRQSSRRRKSCPGDKSDQTNSSQSTPQKHEKESERKAHWHRGLILYAVAVCIVSLLLFWNQYMTPRPQSFLFAEDHVNRSGLGIKNPDASRPGIELHLEDHIYREPITHHLEWTVTADNLRPDGVLKRVYLINGLFPGPTIETRSGDTIIVNVTNALNEEHFTIHWHGLHIKNSMDGAAGVTQSPIPPGSSFLYSFSIPVDQSGTFWYHGHAGLARADGFYGGFVVHKPAPKSTVRGLMSRETKLGRAEERDVLLLIGDWYHRPAPEVMAWYMRAGSFGNEPVPDSLLINGIGYFNCSTAVPARPVDCVDRPLDLSHVLPKDSVYRLRVVNTGSLAGFSFTLENHDVAVLDVDSVPVQPQNVPSTDSAGILYPGQRMDLLARRTSGDRPSILKIDLDEECFKYPNPALTSSQEFFISHPEGQKLSTSVSEEASLGEKLSSKFVNIQDLPSTPQVLSHLPRTPTVQRTEVVYTKIQKLSINQNIPYGVFNRTSWAPQIDPPVPLINLQREQWDDNQFGITIPASSPAEQSNALNDNGREAAWIDLVVNNLDEGGHPFHLHGHHFYILAVHQASIGWGSYNPFTDLSPPGLDIDRFPETNGYDLSRAMLRDTVYIPSRAYAVLRFRADNPGIWLFHCHILWHLASGMAMVVDIR
ncbi:multicopper oxidase-domain-containing protein [Aspergillus granulosus]|uniref:Multicopper oxidase-domain-containing protein n=1 Tax=Aspergillus granulosus TaxID=176169 RepID=A0ABR4GYA2_9EURO